MTYWSPYWVGIGIGILSWLTFLLSDKPIGCSTAFSRFSGMIEQRIRGKGAVMKKPYYQKVTPVITWDVMLVVGILIGSLLSARLSGEFALRWTPEMWATTFSSSPLLRVFVAFVGGILMGIGSRWAGGCTSGHGISGTLQLAVSSWLAVMCFFVGGIVTAMLIFRVFAG
ncbi:MAG: YeeE/YedE family protein [Anaerolineae bacterium]|nr:YeeE/YedE family protein [Anaerolineae bacterium]